MARIYPEMTNAELMDVDSTAEVKLYKLFRDNLDDKYVVIFQPRWILKRESNQAKDGETDFVIAHPDFGYFCLEIKGGGIQFDGSNWHSIDRNKVHHEIRNPIKQAMDAKYAIRSKLFESGRITEEFRKVPIGHAVFFPDTESPQLFIRSDLPVELVGARSNLSDIANWVNGVLNFWSGEKSASLGNIGITQLVDVLVRPIQIDIKLGAQLTNLEERRIRLTQDQTKILDFLESRRRVAISGGAGTGKTVIAIEKAKRLAADGFKTLLTCYNRELSNFIASQVSNVPNLTVSNFDRLSDYYVNYADHTLKKGVLQQAKATYPNTELWQVQMPAAMTYALEYIEDRFDAIVVDEAQDFPDEYWFPLEYLLSDFQQSPFYIFYDTHQNLYRQSLQFPISESPFTLNRNCRNTAEIHEFAYKNYEGPVVHAGEMHGSQVTIVKSSGTINQAKEIHKLVVKLVSNRNVLLGQIAVLIGDSLSKKEKYSILREMKLPHGGFWSIENGFKQNHLLVDTVKRFKGLEAEIVILWGLPDSSKIDLEEILYVGATRAKSQLIIVGDEINLADL